jgi:alkylation response protein AidB-like acyl-CoA dehydrogenase
MDFAHSDEQLALRDAARDWLGDHYPADRVVALADDLNGPGADPGVWAQLERLGWVDAATDGAVTTGVLLEETGRALLPAPFFATVALAAPLGAPVSAPTTLAWAEHGAPRLGDPITTTLDGDLVTGTKVLVPDLATTTHAVVTTTGGNRLVALADAEVVHRSTLDRTRRLGDLVLDATPSTPLPDVDLAAARTTMLALAAAEAVGVARRCLEIAAAHVSIREQFGRVIGTYQGVSHKVADMYVSMELARSLTVWACWAIDAGDPSAAVAASSAKAMAGPAAVLAAEHAIQVHGGLGFTWDSVLHRYYKRAQWLDAFEGSRGVQRAAVADAILGAVA